ncbi:ATPase, T2SS/T4P/T4SS family [Methanothermococcus okinawensis]|uniref:Transcriptional regulator, XRE family n=1 Tax=Methanothermococcus okinawensis (strain DSM 14208 / JCM 11175 / IH1) TaxID=647113 RepID=F8AM15_METOI|nr:ATPase, T2SS/T4P/T4SS family [Methanothermococcus okinawensis]AEH06693.1 transcriptional regulator, XRE family [Methanothermococcus okinawensis IH1]
MSLFDRIKNKDVKSVSKPSSKKNEKIEKESAKTEPNIVLRNLASKSETQKVSYDKKITNQTIKIMPSNVFDNYFLNIDGVVFNIIIGKKEGQIYYNIPEVSQMIDALSKLSDKNISEIKADISNGGFQKIEEIQRYLLNYSEKNNLMLKNIEIQNLAKYFYLTIGKLGFLEVPLHDDNLEEIMVNGVNQPTFVFHKKYQMCKTNIKLDDSELTRIIENIAMLAGRTIDARTPMLDAFLPDGSRVNATTKDVTLNGSTLTIRKFSADPLTVVDLIKYRTFDLELAAFLWQAVEGYFGAKPANTLIVGGTGSGKTTTLNVISMFSMYTDRIVTIEDTPELQIPHDHVIKMITRPPRPGIPEYEITMDDLIKNALRMRPDRIFVGEVRGKEAHSLLVAMNTGHDGALVKDEPIYLANGNIINIGKFVDNFFKKYNLIRIKENNGFEWIDISDENIFIKSFNKTTLKIEDKLISRVWRKEYSGKLIKIKTKSGKEITLTHDHPVYIIKNSRIFEINSEMININDYIALPRLDVNSNKYQDNKIIIEEHSKDSSSNDLEIIPNIGKLIKYYRLKNKLTQEELLDELGLKTKSLIRDYELGVNNPPRTILNKIAEILNAEDLKVIANSDMQWDKVVSVEEINYNGYLYDLTVNDNHTYIAGKYGGFIVSNCSGTLHANSADEAIIRLINPPMNVPKVMISSLDFIINQQRIKRNRKTVRRVLGVMEITGSGEDISKTGIFKYEGVTDSIKKEGICMWEEEACNIAGISRDELIEDRLNRIEVLKYAVKNNIRDVNGVGNLIRQYQENPENLLKNIIL